MPEAESGGGRQRWPDDDASVGSIGGGSGAWMKLRQRRLEELVRMDRPAEEGGDGGRSPGSRGRGETSAREFLKTKPSS